ncbi:hypothetical protein, partial [Salmonella enterica]
PGNYRRKLANSQQEHI